MDQLENKTKKDKKNFATKLFNKKKLAKPQRVAVLYIRKNGTVQTYEAEAKKGFFSIDERTYHIDRDCRYNLILENERIPLFIQEEDGLKPSPNSDYYEHFKKLEDFEQKVAESQNMAIRAIRHAELVRSEEKNAPKINPKTAVAIGIILIIAFAIFRSYA